MSIDYDYLFKIVLTGDHGVGKSQIFLRYTKNEFHLESKTTIGVEFGIKEVSVNSKKVKAQIWDTAGQERFRAITRGYYRDAVGAIIAFDITRYSSFSKCQHWLDEVRYHTSPTTSILLIGNKADLNHSRAVATSEAQRFAERNNLKYIETSALSGLHIEDAFNDVIKDILYKVVNSKTEDREMVDAPSVQPQTEKTNSSNSFTCCKT